MKRLFCFLICLSSLGAACVQAQTDTLYIWHDARMPQKHPWRAAAQTFGINAAVWAFDRYILDEDFARISLRTIGDNIKSGFVWDNDLFSTNLFAHPYHGSLYYNAARSNGLTFWESAPYALGGSLMWEIVAEAEPPSTNDLLATTIGGIALGEFTYRMSSLVLDDSKRGFTRFTRELLGTLINPVRGLNRLLSGDMWKVKPSHYKYHDYDRFPVRFSIGLGSRFIGDDTRLFQGGHTPNIDFRLHYGDAFDPTNDRPYDHFTAHASLSLFSKQPLLHRFHLTGQLWATPLHAPGKAEATFGIFQHFYYFDSEEVKEGSGRIPYKISETASFGPGILYRTPLFNGKATLEQRTFLSAILLGGSLTDHYRIIDRNYNMGSGYSLKSHTLLDFPRCATLSLDAHLYRLFSWKGYEHKNLHTTDPLHLDTQGDKGHITLAVITPSLEVNLTSHLKAALELSYYHRHTHYSYYEDVKSRTVEARVGLVYEF